MSDILNRELIEELRMIMEDEFSSLMDTFLQESAKQFDEAKVAWSAGDMDTLRRSAHTLKGSCGNVGAVALQGTCETLETNAKAGSTDGMAELLDIVGQQLLEVNSAIQAL
jgi:HPt (histidine-containing phosphotransfer) domain-containing protein